MNNNSKTRDYGDIYRFICNNRLCSRQQIAQMLSISLPTVNRNLTLLTEDNLISLSGSLKSTGGRKASGYNIIPDARYAIGIDLTRNHVSIVLVNLRLEILGIIRKRLAFEDTPAYYDTLAEIFTHFLDAQPIDKGKILGVGIGIPALVKSDHETISYITVLSVSGNLYGEIKSRIPFPCLLFNDSNSAGLAESRAFKYSEPVIYLFLGNSVGGALMIDGKPFTGSNWRASEFGHMKIIPNGKMCYCGKKGCLDAYCNARALSAFTDDNVGDFFTELANGNLRFKAAFEEYTDYLALAINTLRMCYDSDIILGGIVGVYLDNHLPLIRKKAMKFNHLEKNADYILACHYKTEAVAVGAAIYFIDSFFESM